MANFIQKGEVIDFTNTTDNVINYGDVIPIGKHVGVAAESISAGAVGSVRLSGVFEMTVASGVTIAVGDDLYYDVANKVATNIATETKAVIGYAISASTDGVVACKLV